MISLNNKGKIKDLTGKRFGRLTAVAKTEKRVHRHVVWECQCDCGNKVFVASGSLLSGSTRSCGCLLDDSRRSAKTTHHKSNDRIYKLWQGMRKRCFSPTHKNFDCYGGRGIKVCEEWDNSFQAFYDHVSQLPHFGEPGYSLDRIDNDGNYEPGNVRWATAVEQANNRRKKRISKAAGFSELNTEPLRQLYVMTAYLTDEDRVALRVFCEERNIPLEFIEN